MRTILYLTLFFSITCLNLRKNKPSSSLKRCLKKQIGEGPYGLLYDSYKSYSRTNKDETFPDYIKENEPGYSKLVDKCVGKNKGKIKSSVKSKVKGKKNGKTKSFLNGKIVVMKGNDLE